MLVFAAVTVQAQARSIDVRGTLGYTTFIDENSVDHLFTGASVRYYLTTRLSVEPEFVFLYRDRNDKDVGFQANLAWDFRRPGQRVIPYVIGGVGGLKTYFPRFTTSDWMFSIGGGAKIYLNDRWFIAPEARVGLEPVVRLTVSIGYSWRP
jgi:hypothetical protein